MMTFISSRSSRLALTAALLLSAAMPATAQIPAAPAQPVAVDPVVAARAENQRLLTAALTRLASNGTDVQALTQAGRSALALGDPRAALGFLARAEQLAPRDPVIKAALGATMVQLEDPEQAMRFFEAAIALGGLERAYLADRGLAFDLLGDQVRAQADYVAAAQFAPSPEVTRRHAISLGIAGNSDAAVQMLGPLLRTQDRAAWRSRAMIVAMNGRAEEAREIAAATMPAQLASGLSPYFAMMDRLTPPQLAAAAHFGRFPSYETVAAQPVRTARRVEVAAAAAPTPPPARANDRRGNRRAVAANSGAAARRAERTQRQPVRPTPTPVPVPPVRVVEPGNAAPPTAPARVPSPPTVVAGAAAAAATPAPGPAPTPTPVPAPPPLQPAFQPTIRPTIATPPPAVPAAPAPAEAAVVSAAPIGPPDGGVRPGLTALTPAPPQQPVAPAELAAAAPPPAVPAAVTPPPGAPAPAAPPANSVVVAGWSLSDMVGSITVPESERAASEGALSLDELDRIATERRRVAAAAAAEARRREAEERRTREASEAEARARAEREAEQRAEAEARRRHPARIWVQIATGADVGALGFDYRRFSQRNAELFRGQTGHSAVWNRTRRLVVGPFPNAAAARAWLGRYTAAGGDAFVWTSEQGEEVTPLGRR